MRKNVPDKVKIDNILNLLCSPDTGLLNAIQAQGNPIIVVAVPVPRARDNDADDCDDAPDEDCPDYEPTEDGTDRCVYSCPECGICLREYIGEEFE